MGAWNYIESLLNNSLTAAGVQNNFKYVGRESSASPAVGYLYVHNKEQEKIVKKALGLELQI
jgi:2-oxoglutarate dehydrogenase E1 component